MNSNFEQKTLVNAIRTYGYRAQLAMAIEEMSELTKAICKYWRHQNKETCDQILEEMADVEIMLEQMKIMFGNPKDIKEQKIHRLFHRLNKEKGPVEEGGVICS